MVIITRCSVVNKLNESKNLICTEWDELKIKFFIITNDKKLYTGDILKENFKFYSDNFDKTLEDYLLEIKDILEGKQNDIKFSITEDELLLVRGSWVLGRVAIKSSTEIENLTSFMLSLHTEYTKREDDDFKLKKEYAILKNNDYTYKNTVDKIVNSKNELEAELYKRFILVLNSKKEKIKDLISVNKELNTKLENLENLFNNKKTKESVFDSQTDSESESDLKNSSFNKPSVNKKRCVTEDSCKVVKKTKKFDSSDETKIKPIASTSKYVKRINKKEAEEEEEEEEECPVSLEYEEEKMESAIHQNDSEEMFFS